MPNTKEMLKALFNDPHFINDNFSHSLFYAVSSGELLYHHGHLYAPRDGKHAEISHLRAEYERLGKRA